MDKVCVRSVDFDWGGKLRQWYLENNMEGTVAFFVCLCKADEFLNDQSLDKSSFHAR